MSNFYVEDRKCPKCGCSVIIAADNTPRRHEYTYICKCGYESQSLDDFPKIEDKQ